MHEYERSFEVAGAVGAGLIKKYGWKVSLKKYNMEVFADLTGDILVVGVCLSPMPLYIRYIYDVGYQCIRHRSKLGPTSLKPSIAYWYPSLHCN